MTPCRTFRRFFHPTKKNAPAFCQARGVLFVFWMSPLFALNGKGVGKEVRPRKDGAMSARSGSRPFGPPAQIHAPTGLHGRAPKTARRHGGGRGGGRLRGRAGRGFTNFKIKSSSSKGDGRAARGARGLSTRALPPGAACFGGRAGAQALSLLPAPPPSPRGHGAGPFRPAPGGVFPPPEATLRRPALPPGSRAPAAAQPRRRARAAGSR